MKRVRLMLLGAATAIAVLVSPSGALAHEGQPPAPHDVWRAWNWEPFTLTALLAGGVLYGRGLYTVWRQAGVGRGIEKWRAAAFFAGLLALFVALLSPLEGMANVLFSAHMAQHLLLLLVAPPLLLVGRAHLALVWALPVRTRAAPARWMRQPSTIGRLWRLLSKPPLVWLFYAMALWIWHLPPLYQAALRSEGIHILEHATFFGAALLLWWTLVHCHLRGSARSYGMGILLLFTTALHGGLLGWLLTFTSQVWYPAYVETASRWGMTALEDQQLAGAIMWAPAGLVYALAAMVLLGAWLRGMDRVAPASGRQTADGGPQATDGGLRSVEGSELIEVKS